MSFRLYTVGIIACGLLLGSCGTEGTPSLPGAGQPGTGQASRDRFVIDEAFGLRADDIELTFINPTFNNVAVRDTPQGSGSASVRNLTGFVRPIGAQNLPALQLTQALLPIQAQAPNDAPLSAEINLGSGNRGLALQPTGGNPDEIRVGTVFLTSTLSPLVEVRVRRIFTDLANTRVTIEGDIQVQALVEGGVLNQVTGQSTSNSIAFLEEGTFRGTFDSVPLTDLPGPGGITVGQCAILTDPGNPGPGQAYTISVQTPTGIAGVTVTGNVVGTDGFNSGVTGITDGVGIATLAPIIPGGSQSVRDTITVTEPPECAGVAEIVF